MPKRLLQLDDLRNLNSADNIADVFSRLGYNAEKGGKQLAIEDLELSSRSAESIENAYLIADHERSNESLQVMLFQLQPHEWTTASAIGNRMRSIAQSLSRRPSNFLVLGTANYDQLALVNPRRSLDDNLNLKVGIRKLLIDRHRPTAYDRDRLEAIAAHDLSPQQIYQKQCEAFDVEKLTKQFYKGYQELFAHVSRTLKTANQHQYFNDPIRLEQFAQRLLGRVMFLYFLQKKGFLATDRDFLKHQFRDLNPEPEDGEFYTQILEPLFFDILNQQRDNHHSPFGKIPYLNGGLFERDYGTGIIDGAGIETPISVFIPNSLFDPSEDKSVLKFFNSYNFTIAENMPDNEDVAVDPEMLGKVFENLLEANERGKSGTFYTPRRIVHFMCVESLSRYLADETGLEREFIARLVAFDPAFPNLEVNKLNREQTKQLKQALESVKICDLAVGSGAFPMGMMQAILGVKQAIAYREGMTVVRGSLTMSEWKRQIVANNLYGVDIKPEAIDIAKLRMWLSMVVDIPNIDDVEPLPNLDYKLMCGNSLISLIDSQLDLPDESNKRQLELAVTPVQVEIEKLAQLQHEYFYAQSDNRREIKASIIAAETSIFQAALAQKRNYLQSQERELNADIQAMKGKVNKAQATKQQNISTKLAQLKKLESAVARGLRAIDFFQWKLHFSEVFRAKRGFDIVIGNPPYVRQEAIKPLKPLLEGEYECYVGTADLFVYFFEKGFKLLKPNGILTYICSNKYMRSGYGEKLRDFLSKKGTIQHLIDFGDAPVFEAIAYPSIVQVGKSAPKKHQLQSLSWEKGNSLDNLSPLFRNNSFTIAQKELTADGWRLESPATLRLMEKLRAAGMPLGEYVGGRFYYGIKTGFNDAFVVDRATRDRFIAEHPSSAEVLKPYLRGRDVKRWSVNFAEQYLIKIESSSNKQHSWSGLSDREAEKVFALTYPAIHEHFQPFRNKLIKRDDQGKYFWELRACKYWQEFEQPKIIIPAIASAAQYSMDITGAYSNDKTSICIAEDPEYIIGLLNSKILWWIIQQTASAKQGGFYEFKPMYVSKLPIINTTSSNKKIISNIVQKCLDAKGQNVSNWEAEIDDRVAHFYGLTPDELKLIRGN